MNSSKAFKQLEYSNFTAASLPTTDHEWQNSEAFTITFYVFVAFVVVLGVMGNGLVIMAITLRPHMKNVINFYIRNLAVADLLILLIALPLAVVKVEFVYNWPLGKFTCEVIAPLAETSLGVSAWTMTAIALERQRAIVCNRYNTSLRYPKIAVVVTWVVSFILCSMPLLFVTRFVESWGSCRPQWPKAQPYGDRIFNMATSVLLYVVPLIIILFTYISITIKINESRKFNRRLTMDRGTDKYKNQCRHEEKRIKIVMRARRILTPVVIVFAIAMLPLQLIKLTIIFYPSFLSFKYITVLIRFCFFLASVNSACNPLIYSLVCTFFRKEIQELLKCNLSVEGFRRRKSSFSLSLLNRSRKSSERSNN